MHSYAHSARPPPSLSYPQHHTEALYQPPRHMVTSSQCPCVNCISWASDASTSPSPSERPRKSRRLKYPLDDGMNLGPAGHWPRDPKHSPRTPNSLSCFPPTPPSSCGSLRLSKSARNDLHSATHVSEPRSRGGAAQQFPSSKGSVSEAGSWCGLSPIRNRVIPDFVLFDDDSDNGRSRRHLPRCPSPPVDRMATPDLAPLCTDFEFCSCCAHDKMISWGCRSQRRTKLESQGVFQPDW